MDPTNYFSLTNIIDMGLIFLYNVMYVFFGFICSVLEQVYLIFTLNYLIWELIIIIMNILNMNEKCAI
jgi:hypothetical protein